MRKLGRDVQENIKEGEELDGLQLFTFWADWIPKVAICKRLTFGERHVRLERVKNRKTL